MDIKDELDDILKDPLLDLSEKEKSLFDIPEDMRNVHIHRKQPDYYAQRKVCEDFIKFQAGFLQIHKDLKEGKRSLVKTCKTDNMLEGRYYLIDNQLVYLESIGNFQKASNGLKDGRTRCVFENGTETDVLLQTLRKNVIERGYAITDTQEEIDNIFSKSNTITDKDKITGYVYILSSLSTNPDIVKYQDLYKIGFTENSVDERIANAENEPTYLMAPVKCEASYKIINMNSHKLETLIHQFFDAVQLQLTVIDANGRVHHPQEWYIAPLEVINTVIEKIIDGSIVQYTYNPTLKCLVKNEENTNSTLDTNGLKVLSMKIKKDSFDEIMSSENKVVCIKLKQTTLNKYTYIDPKDNKRYLKRYDAIRLYVSKNGESATLQVIDTIYNEGNIEYHLKNI